MLVFMLCALPHFQLFDFYYYFIFWRIRANTQKQILLCHEHTHAHSILSPNPHLIDNSATVSAPIAGHCYYEAIMCKALYRRHTILTK